MSSVHKHNYSFFQKFLAFTLPIVISTFHRILLLTCKKIYILPNENFQIPSIWVAWHGQFAFVPNLYRKIKPNTKINIIVSEHLHGDIAIKSFKRFKFDYIRGSSRKGAIKALIKAVEVIEKGEDVGITPDGPKGPVYIISDGAIVLSLKSNKPIIACGWSANRYWQLKSWDMAKIPKPFSTITYKVMPPIYPNGIDKEEMKKIIQNAIMQCMN